MIKTRLEQSAGCETLVLEGEMIIDHAAELKNVFLDALRGSGSLSLVIEGITKVDLFGLQVLCAAHHSAEKAGKALTLTGKQPEALRDAVVEAGYGRTVACSLDITCPWNEG